MILILVQEFASLDDEAKIYKLVGPVLLKQDTSEAKSTVDSRLEYIEKEMYVDSRMVSCTNYANNLDSKRVEDNIKGLQEQSESKRMEVRAFDFVFMIRMLTKPDNAHAVANATRCHCGACVETHSTAPFCQKICSHSSSLPMLSDLLPLHTYPLLEIPNLTNLLTLLLAVFTTRTNDDSSPLHAIDTHLIRF